MIDADVLLVDPIDVPTEERIPGEPLPVRAVLRAGDERDRRPRRAPAGDPDVGARRPGPPRAVRERGRGRDPERPAVRPGRGPERPAPRARRGQGRLPARRQPQPPDAADEHPGLRRPARDRPARPPARDHRRAGRPAVADGPPAPDRDPARVGRPPAAEPRSSRWRRASAGPGRRWRPSEVAFAARRPSRGLARRRRRRPARPGAVGAARQRREVRQRIAGRRSRSAVDEAAKRLRLTIADHGPGVAEADRARLFGRFERGQRADGRRRQRPRAVRLARAVPGDGRRPRARAAGAGAGRGVQRLPAGRAARRELSRNLAMPPGRRDEARPRPERRSGRSGSARRPCGAR